MLATALDNAYQSEDRYLIAFVSLLYGKIIYKLGNIPLSVMYSVNGLQVYDALSFEADPYDYQFTAEVLYGVHEYRRSMAYAKKGVAGWQKKAQKDPRLVISCMNTVALNYHRLHVYDSALLFYNKALESANGYNTAAWMAIVSGNMGQVYFALNRLDTAYALLQYGAKTNTVPGLYDDASNSLQWAARTSLAMGNTSRALAELREAFALLKLQPDPAYLRNMYYTGTQIFRAMGNADSAFYYNDQYGVLNAQLENTITNSSLEISEARLNDETSRYKIQLLKREKRADAVQRNVIVAVILLLCILTLYAAKRKQRSAKRNMENQKWKMEQEMELAKAQLDMLSGNLVEKSKLIGKLEKQAKHKETIVLEQEMKEHLSLQTILTEEECLKFKTLFEKIYPDYLPDLKKTVSDITLSEQRMAALLKLHFTTRQIASILGISPNSVNKTKQRLRYRTNLNADIDIEAVIGEL